jgi:hypothetical protein
MAPKPVPVGPRLRPRQLDLLSASLRHVRDSEALLDETARPSVDQAWHLIGFGPECVRKACLAEDWADKPLGHDLGDRAALLLDFAVALDPNAWRLGLVQGSPVASLARWAPEVRYDRTGTANVDETRKAVAAAREFVDLAIVTLWSSGLLEEVPH